LPRSRIDLLNHGRARGGATAQGRRDRRARAARSGLPGTRDACRLPRDPRVALTVWIDKQTYLPLRSEEVTPKGTARYEVTRVEYDVAIPEATLRYAPPPGAPVFDAMDELKKAVAGDMRK
jgi:hypothetical protein